MEITQLQYFIAIVQSDCNLSRASERLHISQPALSRLLTNFERDEKVNLFHRQGGRLVGLTPAGEKLYINAVSIVESHNRMLEELREDSSHHRGSIRIGIPPLIVTVFFSEIMAQLMVLNPNITFHIIEKGAFELKNMLLLGEIDLAILLNPNDLNSFTYKEVEIFNDELSAFMNYKHPLANRESISWKDLTDQNLVIFNDTYMIHHQLSKKLTSERVRPKLLINLESWDFMFEFTRKTDFITIQPSPIKNHAVMDCVRMVRFRDPIKWKVVVNYEKKEYYSNVQEYVLNSIVNFTQNQQPIVSIETFNKSNKNKELQFV